MRAAALVVMLAAATGVDAQGRLETPTPAGRVPPPAVTQAPELPPGTAVAEARHDAGVDVGDVIRRFAAAYAAQESPRVMVYFNRELSADVREWVASERVALEVESRSRSTGPDGDRAREGRGGAAVSRQYANVDGGRVGPGEVWMWEFEQAIADLLLDAQVNLIDRAVAMRRQAAEADTVLGNPASTRRLEMEALDQFADLLFEVWVVRSADSAIGYEFRAQAKDIRSGRLLSTVTTWGDGLPRGGPRPVVATAQGYQYIDEVPSVHDAAQAVGVELMESLVRRWR